MIIFKKHTLPKIVFRTKPWKILLMVLVPSLFVIGLSIGIYFAVKYVDSKKIKDRFNINKLTIYDQYKNREVPSLDENDLRLILVDWFKNHQAYSIITPNDEIVIKINGNNSNAAEGMIKFNALFIISNNHTINQEFCVEGFKKQLRPNFLPSSISIKDTDLSNVFPTDLIDNNVLNPNSTYYATLKQYLFNALENKPNDLSINDFDIKLQNYAYAYNNWDGFIYIQYMLNQDKYKYPNFVGTTKVVNFFKYDLTPLTPDVEGNIIINVSDEYKNQLANNVDDDNIKSIIIKYLIGNNNIPLIPDDINIDVKNRDNLNGQITLRSIQLNNFNPIKIYSNVIIKGFLIKRPLLKNNLIEQHIYESITAKEVSIYQLQEIIYNNLIIPNGLDLKPFDISIVINERNNINGIVICQAVIKEYINEPFNETITIKNFKIARPDPLNSTYNAPSSFANLKPSMLSDAILQRMIYSFLVDAPIDLTPEDIAIIQKNPRDDLGEILVVGNIPKYNEREPFNFQIKIINFNI